MIDDIDKHIVNIVQQDGRISNAEIARQVGLAASAVLERIRKLEERGVIRGYFASVDPKQVGIGNGKFPAVSHRRLSIPSLVSAISLGSFGWRR